MSNFLNKTTKIKNYLTISKDLKEKLSFQDRICQALNLIDKQVIEREGLTEKCERVNNFIGTFKELEAIAPKLDHCEVSNYCQDLENRADILLKNFIDLVILYSQPIKAHYDNVNPVENDILFSGYNITVD